MTIVELLLGSGISAVLLVVLVTGATMLQRQFAASTVYAEAQSDQIRVIDFVEMDLRRASTVTMAASATPLTLTIPNYYSTVSGRKRPRLPTKAGTKVQYGVGSVTVTYGLQGTRLVRSEAGAATTIGSNVQSFPAPVQTGSYVATTLSFNSKLKRSGAPTSVTLTAKALLRNLN